MLFDYKNIIRLNKTEKSIYRYVINHIDEVLKMNIRDLAEATFVSTATIVRFTQKMDCQGFNDFRNQLQEYRDGKQIPDRNEYDEMIDREFSRIDSPEMQEKIRKLAEKISKSDLTVFIGTGKSGYIAGFAARYMVEIGYNAMAVTDPFYPQVRNHTENMTVIALSTSGETIEVVDQLRAYRELGASVCSITGNPDSTVSRLSQLSLSYNAPEEVLPSMSSLTTCLPIVYMIENTVWYLISTEGRTKEVAPVSFHE